MEDYRIIERLDQILDALKNPPVKDLDIIEIDENFSICRGDITSIEKADNSDLVGLKHFPTLEFFIRVKSRYETVYATDKWEIVEDRDEAYDDMLRLWKGEANGPS